MVRSLCKPEAFQAEINKFVLSDKHKILHSDFGYNFNTKVADVICTCVNRIRIKKILPVARNMDRVICYPQCPRSLFTSTLRQCVETVVGSKLSLNQKQIKNYHSYCNKLLQDEIIPLIKQNFNYDVNSWLNHLKDRAKQEEIMPFYNDYLNGIKYRPTWERQATKYTLFSKEEKQIVTTDENGKSCYPKCRAISACSPTLKWIMGPVILELERIIGHHFKGYKINNENGKQYKTWEEIEDFLEDAYSKGMTHSLDIDGSRWDTTQRLHMRYLSFKIYEFLADNGYIHHVDQTLFKNASTAKNRTLTAKTYINNRSFTILSVNLEGTMFSGSPDTTFANTITNASVGRYIIEEICQLSKTSYKLMTAGDDYSSITDKTNNSIIAQSVSQVWSDLGLHPKYVLEGDFSEITFCSTNVIPYKNQFDQQKFKLVRQIDRMNPLSHYSIQATSYSRGQLKKYYNSLADGLDHWAHNMPYYSQYSKAFRYHAQNISEPEEMPINGKPKLHFITSTNKDYEMESNDYEAHKDKTRLSSREPPATYVDDFLLVKFGITPSVTKSLLPDLTQHINYYNG